VALEYPPPGIGVVEPPDGAVVGALVAAGVGVTVLVCAKLTAPAPSSVPAVSATAAAAPIAHWRTFVMLPPFSWIEASVGRTTRPLLTGSITSSRMGRVVLLITDSNDRRQRLRVVWRGIRVV
jgi:hypothetical protein